MERLHPKARFNTVNEDQQERIMLIREAFSETYRVLDHILLPGRESSLAQTKLEEAMFWAIKGISREVTSVGK